MLFITVSSLAALALAGQAVAEPLRQPYKLKLSKMSVNSIFGLSRRQSEGYAPEQQFCGAGDTCAEACGKGFEQCSSNDGVVHCFNKSGKQTCCPGLTGDSCDAGYFCSADDKGATWCCPDSMTLEQCAAAYNLPGSLVSETAPSTTTTTKSAASTPAATTTNATTVKVVGSTTTAIASETTSDTSSSTTSAGTTVTTPAASPAVSSTTSSAASSTSATPPDNGIVQAGGDNLHVSMGGMVLLAAAAFAALL
ncbi:hypothetical protein Hte_004831 [Hypoxylon texense]